MLNCMGKPKRAPVTGPCSYCGQVRELEPEHVVPEALFFDKSQAKAIIPACKPCNREKAEGEGDLRDYMITSKRGRLHPVAQKLLPQYKKAVRKGASRIGKRAETAPIIPRVTAEDIYLGYNVLGDFDDFPEMERSLRYITRGLHFHETGAPILPTTTVDIRIFPHEAYPAVVRDFDKTFLPRRRILGPDVFSWQPLGIESSSGKTGWVLRFYDGVAVVCMTGGTLGLPNPPRPQQRFVFKKPQGRRQKLSRDLRDFGLVSLPPEDYLSFLFESMNEGK
jgi:hypothetical protein